MVTTINVFYVYFSLLKEINVVEQVAL